jgi:hypothetical protein
VLILSAPTIEHDQRFTIRNVVAVFIGKAVTLKPSASSIALTVSSGVILRESFSSGFGFSSWAKAIFEIAAKSISAIVEQVRGMVRLRRARSISSLIMVGIL